MRPYQKAILALLVVAGCFGYGFLSHRNDLFPAGLIRGVWARFRPVEPETEPDGYWARARADGRGGTDLTPEEASSLLSLPYLQGTQPATLRENVTVHVAGAAYEGLNLYVSGHGPEATLMDMRGRTLHRWGLGFADAFPGKTSSRRTLFWRRARLLDNGDLLAIYEYAGIVRIDADSKLLWSHAGDNHHDLDVDGDGRIFVLGQRNRVNPLTEKRNLIADDLITILSPDGEVLDELSIYDCFARSDYASLLEFIKPRGDIFHTNTVTLLDGSQAERSPAFRKGNILVSVRQLNTIAVIEPESRRVVWALAGLWTRQHEPVPLDHGRMLVFDNNPGTDRSRVIEFDPLTQEIFWRYEGTDERPFYSEIGGSNQRLPNGNTLITESDYGRAFEVTPDGDTVWEFVSPHRAGEDDELVAVLFEVVRLDPDIALPFLTGPHD